MIYRALGCTGFARVDCFLTPCGEIVFNEVNTIPGFLRAQPVPRHDEGRRLLPSRRFLDTILGQVMAP